MERKLKIEELLADYRRKEQIAELYDIREEVVAEMNTLEIAIDATEDAGILPVDMLEEVMCCIYWDDMIIALKRSLLKKEKFFEGITKKLAELNAQEYGEEKEKK